MTKGSPQFNPTPPPVPTRIMMTRSVISMVMFGAIAERLVHHGLASYGMFLTGTVEALVMFAAAIMLVLVVVLEFSTVFLRSSTACSLTVPYLAILGALTSVGTVVSIARIVPIQYGNWTLVAGTVVAIYFFASSWQLNSWKMAVQEYQRRQPVCRSCGFCLIGTIHARQLHCPECGDEVPSELARLFAPREPNNHANHPD